MAKFTVLHTDSRDPNMMQLERPILAEADAEIVVAKGWTEDAMIESARDVDAILTSGFQVNRRVIESLRNCKVIVRYGIGFDNIDVDAATDCGIPVANVPDYCIEEVSNHAMTLILACSRKLCRTSNVVKAGGWAEARMFRPPMGKIQGETLGLVAFGKIAQAVAAKAKAFGLRILVHDPYISPEVAARHGVELTSLERLLAESDYISTHTPLTKETRNMFNADRLRQMKRTAYLINTSRGGVIDEAALYQALKEGWIAGAGLDVFDKEPTPPDNPLLTLENLIATNHMAFYSDVSGPELRRRVAQEAARVLRGYWPQNLVNPAVRSKVSLKD